MPTATYIQDGHTIDHTPGSALAAGDVVVIGDLIGIAKVDIPANTLGALATTGVFDVPKTAGVGEAIPAGAKVYWDVADQVTKEDAEAGANKYLGKTTLGTGDNDTTTRVKLEQ